MRKVLIPTDFSDNAMNALVYAMQLFKYQISEFYIVHAYQDEIYEDESLLTRDNLPVVRKKVSNKSKERLQELIANMSVHATNPKHTFHGVSSNDLLVDLIDGIVEAQNIDIIVMATRGKTNNKKITFGSYTLQILRYVQCPVLVIPQHYKYQQPEHVLFPTNYMIPYKRRELKLLCEMASPFRAAIDVLYISKSSKLSLRQEDNKRFIKEELYKNEVHFKVVKSRNIKHAIYEYIKGNNIDMLVMVNTRHSFLENILNESIIDTLSLNLNMPFLALQNTKRD